jgi:signal transduction histidine kinase
MRWPARSSLGWRLYAVGLVQLLLVAVAVLCIGAVVARLPRHGDMQALIASLKPFADRPAELAKACSELRTRQRLLLSIYDDARQLVVSNVDPPLREPRWGASAAGTPAPGAPAALSMPQRSTLPGFSHRGGSPLFARRGPPPDTYAHFEMNGHEGLLVARFEWSRPSYWPPLLTLLFGLLIVSSGAWLTTRWIARPLEQLARAARSLGEGDLHARTELTRADELGAVGQAFDEMAGRVQALLVAEKELLANVSHELRTPLARIRVALEIAAEGDLVATRASLAEIAVDLAELEVLIDDVLAATRTAVVDGKAVAAGFALHPEEIAPGVLCERAAERFRVRHPQRALAVRIQDGLPVVVADPVLFRRVLDNLLENAHKYSPDASSPVALHVAGDSAAVSFEIADRGAGIPSDELPRIFKPFYRGERSRSRDTGGVGLGLTITKRIVEAHGGTVEIDSTPGVGTTVRVSLGVRALG